MLRGTGFLPQEVTMSTFDLVCAECGFRIAVPEKCPAGAKFRCSGCGKILEVPPSEHTGVPVEGEHSLEWWRVFMLGLTAKRLPEGGRPRGRGWGQFVRQPDGKIVWVSSAELQGEMRGKSITAEEALRRRGLPAAERELLRQRQYKGTDHVITLQGGMGVCPPDRPCDPNPSKEVREQSPERLPEPTSTSGFRPRHVGCGECTMSVPKYEKYYLREPLNADQRTFLSHWVSRWRKGEAISVNGQIGYLFEYLISYLHEPEQVPDEVPRLLAVYGMEDEDFDWSCRKWISDYYLMKEDYEAAIKNYPRFKLGGIATHAGNGLLNI